MRTLRKLFHQKLILCVGLMLLCGFLFVPSFATEKYFSNTKSPTGVMEPRDMYFPGTEKLASDEMRIVACGTGMPAARRGQAATCNKTLANYLMVNKEALCAHQRSMMLFG